MAGDLFRRAWKVQVDTIDVGALDIEFRILSTAKPFPNKCTVTLWNVNQDHRAQLYKRNRPNGAGGRLVGVPTRVEAGYVGNSSIIFDGDLREVTSKKDGPTWKTVLAGDDGGRSYREAEISKTFAEGTPFATVLQQCAEAMGIGTGNLSSYLSLAQIPGLGKVLPNPMVLDGSAKDALTRLTASMGLTWSVHRGALQLAQKGKPLDLGAIEISSTTGLIGSPEATIDSTIPVGFTPIQIVTNSGSVAPTAFKPKDGSVLRVQSLLIPGLVVGRKIRLQSKEFNGGYYIREIEYIGQSFGNDWHCNMIVRTY